MNHLSDADLALLAQGDLTPQSHLEECEECRARVEDFHEVASWLNAVAPEPGEAQLAALRVNVLEAVSRRRSFPWRISAAAALALFLLFASSRFLGTKNGTKNENAPPPSEMAELPMAPPVPVRLPLLPKRLPRRPAKPRGSAPFQLVSGGDNPVVRLKTSDPNVVVLWVMNTETKDRNGNE